MERELEEERERERAQAGRRERDAERYGPRESLRRVVRERAPLSLRRPSAAPGEPVNLDLLYRDMHGGLVRYAMRAVDADEAKDVVHDAMLKYLEQVARQSASDPADEARPRLVAMVHDVLLDRQRTDKRRKRLMQLISGSTAAIRRWTNPRRSAEDDEILRSIRDALESMHPSYRVAWTTVKEQGMTPEETARLLGISAASVRAALHKANTILRRELARDGITPATMRGRDDV